MQKAIYKISTLVLLAVLYSFTGYTQKTAAKDLSSPVATDSNWRFTALFVSPQKGGSRPVNGSYFVEYRDHKLRVFLPYFGEAYGSADLFSGKNPLDFSSVDFITQARQTRKAGTEIIFKPKDNSEVISMDFTWYENGRADLFISMTSRSGISFSGTMEFLK